MTARVRLKESLVMSLTGLGAKMKSLAVNRQSNFDFVFELLIAEWRRV
jgi:hypothetical protein